MTLALTVFVFPTESARGEAPFDYAEAGKFWSFQPPQPHPLAKVKQTDWPRKAIDHFVLARIEGAGVEPNSGADSRMLLRRASYALTGLPPNWEKMKFTRLLKSLSSGKFHKMPLFCWQMRKAIHCS